MIRLLFIFFLIPFLLFGQQDHPRYSKTVENKISKVENHLNGWVKEINSSDWTLKERMSYYHVNGVSIAVIHHFKLDWIRGYGWADKEEQKPVTVHTAFQAGSISKTVNALALLKLVEEGKLQLDSDINLQLKTWKFPYDSISQGNPITLRQLLSHRAGLNMSGFAGYSREDELPNIYQILDGLPPATSSPVRSRLVPGKEFRYSGGGVMISQLIAMDVCAMSYEKIVEEKIFNPLKMKNSFFYSDSLTKAAKATGYYWSGEELPKKYRVYPELAAAGLWSTPEDLAKLLIGFQKSYTGQPQKLFGKMTAHEAVLLDPGTDKERLKSALGVFLKKKGGSTYMTHDGKVEGFLCLYFADLEKGNGVVIMNNSNDGSGLNLEIANSVAKVYGWKDFNRPEERKTVDLNSQDLKAYEGVYNNGKDHITITTDHHTLMFSSNYSFYSRPQVISFLSPEQFYVYEEEFFTDSFGYKNQYFVKRNKDGFISEIIRHVKGESDKIFMRQLN